MNEERFGEMVINMRLMKTSDPNFSVEKFASFSELSDEQRMRLEKEFGKRKKMWIENSLFYNYYENDSF